MYIEVDSVIVPSISSNSVGNDSRKKSIEIENEKESAIRRAISSIFLKLQWVTIVSGLGRTGFRRR